MIASGKERNMRFPFKSIIVLSAALVAIPATAQEREVPYWVSLRSDEVNMRRGPSEEYPIEWVFRRAQLPMKVVRVHEGWRLVQDPDGEEGWISASLLRLDRTALVTGEELAAMRDAPADNGRLLWNAEPGVIGVLGECEAGWCEFDVEGREGWINADRIWGEGEP
jgi:SH3-like domain-containing protein